MKEYVLITGATGFIGSYVAERLLLEKSFHLVAIAREIENYKNVGKLAALGASLVKGDFADNNILEDIFRRWPIEYVIHLAAIRGEGGSRKEDYHRVNVLGTEALLNISLRNGVKRFVHCSSVGVFGTIPGALPGNLETCLNGDSLYHASKIMAEEKVLQFVDKGLDAYIIRPAITYGEGDNGFPAKLVKLMRGRILYLPNNNIIHLLDVRKLAEVFAKSLKMGHPDQRVLIVADKQPICLRELAGLIHAHYYGSDNYFHLPGLPVPFYRGLLLLFKAAGSKKWVTRLRLLCESWYYDVDETSKVLQIEMSETSKEFPRFVGTVE